MRTTCGRRPSVSSCARTSRASSPLAASPTTSMSGSPSRNAKSPRRTTAWSSTTSTRIASGRSGAIRLHRQLDPHYGAASRRAQDLQVSADLLGPAPHRLEPEMAGMDRRRVESTAVVLDLDDHAEWIRLDPNPRGLGSRMLDDVGERLAADPVELRLGCPGERHPALGPVD